MSFSAFLVFLAAGAGLLAAWVLVRFPERYPSRFRKALIHFSISLLLVWAAPNAVEAFSGASALPAVTAVFLLLLPPLVYAWLSARWILRIIHEAIAH
jgi:hypothetical protein